MISYRVNRLNRHREDETVTLARPSERTRLGSLDGLRGAAAVIVLLHHALLTIPSLAEPYFSGRPATSALAWWLVHTPLHLAWAGTEAVFLFFVLSGVVLSLSASVRGFSWPAYFPSRLVRLYAPVVAAVLLGAVTILVAPRTGSPAGDWLASRPRGYSPTTFLQDMLLVGGVSRTISPLWSLQWEVLFSLLLPAYLFIGGVLRLRTQILVACLLSTLGFAVGLPALMYLPMFLIGTAIGSNWHRLERAASRLGELRYCNLLWTAIAVSGFLLTISYWSILPFASGAGVASATGPATLAGVTILILCAAFWTPARWLLSRSIFLWLGRISFSLYLVHEPIVIATAFLVPGAKWALAISIPVSLVMAFAFFRLVELPAHHLARRIKNSCIAQERAELTTL